MKTVVQFLFIAMVLGTMNYTGENDISSELQTLIRFHKDFKRGSFKKVEKEIQKQFDLLPQSEDNLFKFISSISIANKSHLDSINQWIDQNRKSSIAQAVKGMLLVGLAWKERTNSFSKDVKKESWDGMQQYLKEAYSAAKQALNLDPDNYVAHYIILKYRYHYRDKEQFETYYRGIVKKYPNSTAVRYLYLGKLWPRWSGSIADIKKELDKITSDFTNPDGKKGFENYMNFYNAFLARERKDFEECADIASIDESYPLYGTRARCNYVLENYIEVNADFSEVIKSNFLDESDLIMFSKSLYEMGRYFDASRVMDYAIEHYPDNAYFWSSAYFYHYKSNRVTTCKIAESSLEHFPENAYLLKAAVACFDRKKQYRKCIKVGGNAINTMKSNGDFKKKSKEFASINRSYEHCTKMLKK
ncbi:MAG: DUF4034 domain-containing protein [Candidatus Cloacimonetes bacterium]|nr:DUF4034 domain-containing protein [Candidatus Cloacimonadota bacterium]